jgi:AmiR/NasT family two-component response regulator
MGNLGPTELQMTVWRAEGVLMQRFGIDSREALDLLVRVAREGDQTVGELSVEVLAAHGLPC